MCICSIEAAFYLVEGVCRQAANDLKSSNHRVKQDAAEFLKYMLPDFERQKEIRRRWLEMRFNDREFNTTAPSFWVSLSSRRKISGKQAQGNLERGKYE